MADCKRTDLKWLSKKRSDCVTFFCYNTYAAILFSEHYYDKQYNLTSAYAFVSNSSGNDTYRSIIGKDRSQKKQSDRPPIPDGCESIRTWVRLLGVIALDGVYLCRRQTIGARIVKIDGIHRYKLIFVSYFTGRCQDRVRLL